MASFAEQGLAQQSTPQKQGAIQTVGELMATVSSLERAVSSNSQFSVLDRGKPPLPGVNHDDQRRLPQVEIVGDARLNGDIREKLLRLADFKDQLKESPSASKLEIQAFSRALDDVNLSFGKLRQTEANSTSRLEVQKQFAVSLKALETAGAQLFIANPKAESDREPGISSATVPALDTPLFNEFKKAVTDLGKEHTLETLTKLRKLPAEPSLEATASPREAEEFLAALARYETSVKKGFLGKLALPGLAKQIEDSGTELFKPAAKK